MPGFWQDELMREEPLLFVKQPGTPPSGTLLFRVRKISRVTDTAGRIEYREGRDFRLGPDRRRITLTPESRIPVLDAKALIREPGSPNSHRGFRPEDPHRLVDDHFFAPLQPRFTYYHDPWDGRVPPGFSELVPLTLGKLQRKEKLRLVVFGDSISAGCAATGVLGIPPYLPCYAQQVAAELASRFGAKVLCRNISEGGMCASWARRNIDRVLVENPDLLVLAWGMNDASERVTPRSYLDDLSSIMQTVRRSNGQAEFLLVSTMHANPEWTFSCPSLCERYLAGLVQLTGPGVALADLTTVWAELMKRKSYLDLTGNGLNHPNDFGHRVYAQVILAALLNGTGSS
jgi:lysophospholipase L1-like esterase